MIKKFHDPELDEHYISNERVFSGRLLKVELDHVKLPNGSERAPGNTSVIRAQLPSCLYWKMVALFWLSNVVIPWVL